MHDDGGSSLTGGEEGISLLGGSWGKGRVWNTGQGGTLFLLV